ncbi:hypothetical protein PMAYCL1PPCAC_28891, partial [Pristionchus mayeri]
RNREKSRRRKKRRWRRKRRRRRVSLIESEERRRRKSQRRQIRRCRREEHRSMRNISRIKNFSTENETSTIILLLVSQDGISHLVSSKINLTPNYSLRCTYPSISTHSHKPSRAVVPILELCSSPDLSTC